MYVCTTCLHAAIIAAAIQLNSLEDIEKRRRRS
jgi:hypothetical protein